MGIWEGCGTYIATADIFNEVGVDLGLFEDFFEDGIDEEIEFRILETALEGFG